MVNTLWTWITGLITEFSKLGTYLTWQVPYINMSLLGILSVGGIIAILGFLVVRLVIGG